MHLPPTPASPSPTCAQRPHANLTHPLTTLSAGCRYAPTTRPPPHMADVYGSGDIPPLPVDLPAGVHILRFLLTAKAQQAQFLCNVEPNPAPTGTRGLAAMFPKIETKPDLVAGRQFSELISVSLTNPSSTMWYEVSLSPVQAAAPPSAHHPKRQKTKSKKDSASPASIKVHVHSPGPAASVRDAAFSSVLCFAC
jgi:hypothetical protein